MEQEKPQYIEEELERYEKRGVKVTDAGWLQSADGRLLIPENAQWKNFPKVLELTNYVTQLSAFQQALMELQEVTPNPASESSKPLFEPGTELLIKTLGPGGPSLECREQGIKKVEKCLQTRLSTRAEHSCKLDVQLKSLCLFPWEKNISCTQRCFSDSSKGTDPGTKRILS